MDERTLTIVKAMARGPACYDDNSNSICVYCDADDHIDVSGFVEIRHEPSCPVLLARTMLKEQNTPMNIYKVVRKYVSVVTPNRQYLRTINTHTTATSLEEATVLEESANENIHSMHVEFMCEAPIQV